MRLRERTTATLLIAIFIASIFVVMSPAALAWQEKPDGDYWYINAQYVGYYSTGPLVIKLDEDSSSGQTFTVGDTITISVHLHAYAASCGGAGNEAYTEWGLKVNGPSGPDSVSGWDWDYSDSCAEVDNEITLTITYDLMTIGTHTVYASSYAAVAQYGSDVADEYVDASLTFEVVGTKADVLQDKGVPGEGIGNAPGLDKAPPNDNFAKGRRK